MTVYCQTQTQQAHLYFFILIFRKYSAFLQNLELNRGTFASKTDVDAAGNMLYS